MGEPYEMAKKAARAAAAVGAVAAIVGYQQEGRPIKDKGAPAKVRALGLTLFERDESGRQWVLWFRIRNARHG